MSPTRGSPTRPIRLPDISLWERFGVAADDQGSDRSALLREFMAWYLRDPGAKMPKRPDTAHLAAERARRSR